MSVTNYDIFTTGAFDQISVLDLINQPMTKSGNRYTLGGLAVPIGIIRIAELPAVQASGPMLLTNLFVSAAAGTFALRVQNLDNAIVQTQQALVLQTQRRAGPSFVMGPANPPSHAAIVWPTSQLLVLSDDTSDAFAGVPVPGGSRISFDLERVTDARLMAEGLKAIQLNAQRETLLYSGGTV